MSEEFKIDNLTPEQLKLVRKIYSYHQDMTFRMVVKECKPAAHLFVWSKKVLEYVKIRKSLEQLGIKQIEDKMLQYQKISKRMFEVFEKILANQEF